MNKKISVFLLFIAAFAFILPQAHAINWKYDLASALKSAKSQNKPIMIDFYTEWCGWCKKLDSDTYSNSKVSAAAERFICVKIDAEKEPAIANKYGVAGFPTIIFLNSNGNVISKIPGYLPPDRFLANMNKVLSALPKPSAQNDEKPLADGGGFFVLDQDAGKKGKDGKALPAKTVGQEFVYNGYIESGGEGLIAQINYKGNTYFVKNGDNFAEFQVVSADKEKVVLAAEKGDITLEYKKPYGGNSLLSEISRTITEPSDKRSLTDTLSIKESFPALAAGKVRAMILVVSLAIMLIFYVYYALCLQFIAKKTNTLNAWMAWVPILNLFLILNIAQIKYRVVIIPFVTFFVLIAASSFAFAGGPLVGLIFAGAILLNSIYFLFLTAYIWYKVAVARKKSSGLAIVLTILMFISPLNLIAMGYLAFSK